MVALSYVTLCVLWGSTYLAIAVGLESFPPFAMGAVRFVLAGGAYIAIARARKEAWPTRAQWMGGGAAGLFLFVLGNGLIAASEQSLSSSMASVLAATMPLWMTVASRALGTPVRLFEGLGVGLGLVGVVVLNTSGELRGSTAGVVMGVMSPLAWAIGSLMAQRLPAAPGIMRLGVQMLVGGAAMAVVSVAIGERVVGTPSLRATGAVLYLIIAGSLIGFSAYSYLLRHTRPAVATSYAYVNPVIALLLGVLLAGEGIDLPAVIGAAIVLTAVVLVGVVRHRQPAAAATAADQADTGPRPAERGAARSAALAVEPCAEPALAGEHGARS